MDASARRSFHIGRYHCVEALSQGPLGETFRAKVYGVAGLEKQYALKQIDASVRVEPTMRSRLVEAAKSYALLEHERIARLTEFHDEEDSLYLVVELARGIDLPRLQSHLQGRGESLPVEQAILIAVDVAEALDAAQQLNVLHDGLAPSAIAVLGEGEVRVSDFAITAALERPGWLNDDSLVPLLAYMAPERVLGGPATAASDAWSLGAIMFELCTGVRLYDGATVAELDASRGRAVAWNKLPSRPGLRELLTQLLSEDPSVRPQTAAQLREALAGLLGLEIGRARSGLQSLAKRALGRALTRTGSFAAVAIPSGSMPTLVQEPPTAPPLPPTTLQSGKRTIIGLASIASSAPPPQEPASDGRSWAPPGAVTRTEGPIPSATTIPGIGDPAPIDELAQMEMAELPPREGSPASPTDSTLRTREPMFDEGVTAPQAISEEETIDALEEPSLVNESGSFMASADDVTKSGGDPRPPPLPPSATDSGRMRTVTTPTPIVTQPSQLTIEMTAEVPPGVSITGEQKAMSAPTPAPMPVVEAATAPTLEQAAPTSPSLPISRPTQPTMAPPPQRGGGFAALLIIGVIIVGGGALFVLRRQQTPAPVAIVEPKTVEPKTVEPKTVEPKTVEPKTVEPKTVEPKTVEPKTVEPKTELPKPKPPAENSTAPASPGQLAVRSTPPGAQVWLDGEQRGTTPLVTPAPAGKHRLAILIDGHKFVTKQVEVGASGLTLEQGLEPAKLPAEIAGTDRGGLKVRCHTQGELRIVVDGSDSGLTCPNDVRIPVEPGTHEIGLWSPRTGETHQFQGEILEDADHSTRIYTRF